MKKIILLTMLAAMIGGCHNSDIYSGDVYTADQAKQVQHVSYGTIVSLRAVKIQTNSSSSNTLGTIGGGIFGGLLGNTIGKGAGNKLATAGGAIAGAIVGDNIEDKANQTNALELEIRKESGETIVVVQKASSNDFFVGQQVRLVTNNKKISVSSRH